MNYKTALQSVEFFSFHGLYPEEKLIGGKFIVDIIVEQEVDNEASMKRLTEVINYEQLFLIAKTEMDKPRDLIETVAKSILDKISSSIKKIKSVEVKITKHNPAGLFNSGSASISFKI
jgi:dihydroneopterin aldolase